MTYVVAVACRVNGLIVSMPKPARHCDIINRMPARIARAVRPSDQGFLTDQGQFVDRKAGLGIAIAQDQLLKPTTHQELYSEDLW